MILDPQNDTRPGPDVTWTAADGTSLELRPIAPADVDMAGRFIGALSYGTRYFRFGKGDTRFSGDELVQVCTPDPKTRSHLIIVANGDTMAASARYFVQDGGKRCEFALVVADAWQGRGLGTRLLRALIDDAERRGLSAMQCDVLATNARMLDFVREQGFLPLPDSEGAPVRRFSRPLGRPEA
ncbi:MAG TPA: GNAT family N-acetyltransferase [Methyloversatilis sp.]